MRLSPTRLTTLFAALVLFCTAYRLYRTSARDPTSIFFDPRIGYAPRYSLLRRSQALEHISAAPNTTTPSPTPSSTSAKKLCIAIPSTARRGETYLHSTIGSLLADLSPPERSEIHLAVLIAHTSPKTHPAYGESWLPALVDKVLTYDVGATEMRHIENLERDDAPLYLEKALLDYRLVLQHCAGVHTPYIAVVEDDVVAMDGWYHRAMRGVEEAERKGAEAHASVEFLYLRLFYTEEFLGWNRERWRAYLVRSVGAVAVPLGVLVGLRERYPGLKVRVLDRGTMGLVAGLLAAAVGLFFALGRITVLPIPEGVSLMPKYGCCSQALLFPRVHALTLAKYFAGRRRGAPDVLIEEYAEEKGELRWAISPSLFQHVGRKSSSGEESKYGMSVAEKIWSFGFEELDWRKLKEEHEKVIQYRAAG